MSWIKISSATIFLLAFISIVIYCLCFYTPPPWWKGKLVFEENFRGRYLDFTVWEYADDTNHTFGNGMDDEKIEYYSNSLSNNIEVVHGKLKLSTNDSPPPQVGYILRSVQLHQKTFGIHHGAIIVRTRFPSHKFLSSTIRLMHADECLHNQITIVRKPADTLTTKIKSTTLIFGANVGLMTSDGHSKQNKKKPFKVVKNVAFGTSNFDLKKEFHEYGILWTKKKIQWYFDDTKYYEISLEPELWPLKVDKQEISCVQNSSFFNQPMKLVVDLDVYPDFHTKSGDDDEDEETSTSMAIDWIRVYQQVSEKT